VSLRSSGQRPDGPVPDAQPTTPAAWLWAIVVALPARLPVLLFWATLTVCLAVLLGAFRPIVVLPAICLAGAATWRFGPTALPGDRDHRRGAAWALGLALVWLVVNLPFAGEVLLVQRDPGFLTLQGAWLVDHTDPRIPIQTAAEVAAAVPSARVTSDAFWLVGDHLDAQGAKAFPALIAMVGWAAGLRGVLAANLLIGTVGLLAVYDVARRLIGPRWGLVPMVGLALSTPMIYFSRSAFTEPTNIVLTFGGLAVLWGASRDPRMWRFALGGAMVGATALSRIDGAAVSAGLILGLGVVAVAAGRSQRRTWLRGLVVASAMALLMVGLGYLDLARNSPGYLADHRSLYVQLIGLLVACLVAVAGLGALLHVGRLHPWMVAHRSMLAGVAAGSVVLGAVLLASRPLWLQRNLIEPGSGQAWFIAAAQRAAGVAVEGTRSYDEMTVTWLVWYLGPITVLLAVIGAALMLRGAVLRWRPELVVFLATVGVPALLYLYRPAITPDHIWAMRRFLPAVLPAVLLCAAWVLPAVFQASRTRGQRIGAWSLVVSILLAPLVTWGTLVTTTEYGGRADQVAEICTQVQGGRVVVVRGQSPPWLPTLRIRCDADVVEVGPDTSRAELAAIRAAWGEDVVAFTDKPDLVPWASAPSGPWLSVPMARWPHSLFPSRSPVRFDSAVWLGQIEADGSVTPLP
ncbi:MAG: hypothetical protein WCF36_18580, partial [Candidatus Nanopelagicales bacterium]